MHQNTARIRAAILILSALAVAVAGPAIAGERTPASGTGRPAAVVVLAGAGNGTDDSGWGG